jgi:hypothetical protein
MKKKEPKPRNKTRLQVGDKLYYLRPYHPDRYSIIDFEIKELTPLTRELVRCVVCHKDLDNKVIYIRNSKDAYNAVEFDKSGCINTTIYTTKQEAKQERLNIILQKRYTEIGRYLVYVHDAAQGVNQILAEREKLLIMQNGDAAI